MSRTLAAAALAAALLLTGIPTAANAASTDDVPTPAVATDAPSVTPSTVPTSTPAPVPSSAPRSDLGELEQQRLQMFLDRRAKAQVTLSNLLKRLSAASAGIIGNLR